MAKGRRQPLQVALRLLSDVPFLLEQCIGLLEDEGERPALAPGGVTDWRAGVVDLTVDVLAAGLGQRPFVGLLGPRPMSLDAFKELLEQGLTIAAARAVMSPAMSMGPA